MATKLNKKTAVQKDIQDAEVIQETTTPVYDPKTPYRWEETDVFPFSGREYGFIFNTLIQKKTELLQQLEILNILEMKLKDSVERGVAKPEVKDKTISHTLSQADMDSNPELAKRGLKVGDTIQIPVKDN